MPKSLTPRPASQNVMVRLSKNQYENKVIRLMDEKGFFTVSETIRFCIEHTFADLFPAYLERKKAQGNQSPVTSEEMNAESRKNSMIEGLNGYLSDDVQNVTYSNYEEVTVGSVTAKVCTIPVYEVGPETLRLQYRDALGNTGEEAKKRILSIINK